MSRKRDLKRGYIWQRDKWPNFYWDNATLLEPLSKLSGLHGELAGMMSMLGFGEKRESLLSALTEDLMGTSEIEGVSLSRNSVRSSIARRLGMEETLQVEDRYVEGLVDVMMDAVQKCDEALSAERLFDWHAALFPTGRSGMHKITVGQWRVGKEAMQVVSGAMGHERVHYEALPSSAVQVEMEKLISWCNNADLSPFMMAAIAHLWFVTIHPFDDGNGRISRTIADMFLSRLDGGRGRYYSMSAEINHNKKSYYEILEHTQHGGLDITGWLLWFFGVLEGAIQRALEGVQGTLHKTAFWDKFRNCEVNERQRKIVNRLWDGFEGKLTSSKYAKICRCSQDTALRDLNDLVAKGMLVRGVAGGRSVSYELGFRVSGDG